MSSPAVADSVDEKCNYVLQALAMGAEFPPQHVFRNEITEKDYPIIPLSEVQADHDGNVWVCLDGGVYDVTAFLEAHPGGSSRIEMASGQDLSKFWAVYKLHNRPHIRLLLEEFRIGTLSTEDALRIERETTFGNYYESDPERPKQKEIRVASMHPWNSEPHPEALYENFFTPNDIFFVRNHNAVPELSEEDWELEIEGNEALGIENKTFKLSDLKKRFQKRTVVSALQCAGNRQEELITDGRPLYVAPHWRNGAIGNAKWGGVLVRDLLKECGMDIDEIALRRKDTNGMRIVILSQRTLMRLVYHTLELFQSRKLLTRMATHFLRMR